MHLIRMFAFFEVSFDQFKIELIERLRAFRKSVCKNKRWKTILTGPIVHSMEKMEKGMG